MINKIAVVHPEIGLGGPDAVAVWVLESLKNCYAIDLVVCRDVDFEKTNSLYGTSLSSKNINVRIVKIPQFIEKSAKGRLLKQHLLMRFCKAHSSEYDLVFSTYNEMDFGKKGLQYIHFPSMDIAQNAKFNLMINKWYYRDSFLRRAYLFTSKLISGYQEKKMLKNITLVNSDWTGQIVKNIYGIDAVTLYPPIPEDFSNGEWSLRHNRFVYIGIISPDKKISRIVSILKKVRQRGGDVSFHIIGRVRGEGSNEAEQFYRLLEENKDWVFYEGVLSRQEMLKVISKSKFGIHAKKEHFGISIAELITGGCIVFVPSEGGQAEIIGDAKEYLGFGEEDEAVEKIVSVLDDEKLQTGLRRSLQEGMGRFSISNFKKNLLSIVDGFFGEKDTRVNS